MAGSDGITPLVTIVIPTFDGEHWLGGQLESLTRQRDAPPFEVVIADNGSADGTLGVAIRFAERLALRIVDASDRKGQAHARNAGAAAARGAFLLFLDQDDEVEPNYLCAMAAALCATPLVAARVEVRATNPSWKTPPRQLAQEHGLATGGPFPWGYGGALGVHAEVMADLGGFDVRLRDGGEDEDLCWRAGVLGHRCVFAADAVLHYRLPTTVGNLFRQGRRYGAAQVRLERVHRGLGCRSMTARSAAVLLAKCGVRFLVARHDDRGRWGFLLGRHLGTLDAIARRSPEPTRPAAAETRIDGTPAVVIHWREPGRCRSTVESLLAQEGIGPIVVVDNESSLGDVNMPAGVDVLAVLLNLGYAGGANMGLARWLSTDAEFVLVTSHDCELGAGTLQRLIESARSHPDIGVIGPLHLTGGSTADAAQHPAADLRDVAFVSGTCALYRTDCLRAIGGFDAALGSYCEDVDIAERARAARWRVVVDRGAVVASRGSTSKERDRLIRMNAVVVRRRHQGVRAAAREYGRTVWGLLRNLIGLAAPRNSATRRRQSAQRARLLSHCLGRVRDVVIRRPSFHEIPTIRLAHNAQEGTT